MLCMTRVTFTHKKLSKEAKLNRKHLSIYKSWEKIHCPAFDKDVHFTNKGWQHIQQEKWRTRGEKEERLKMLSIAKHILGKATFFQESRLQKYHGTLHQHYGIKAVVGGACYGVVIVEDGGRLDFLSVYKV